MVLSDATQRSGRGTTVETSVQGPNAEDGDSSGDPCVFFFSKRGCAGGNQCAFSHRAVDDAETHARPRKDRRLSLKHRILLQIATAKDAKEIHNELQETARRHPYTRGIICRYLSMSYMSENETIFSVYLPVGYRPRVAWELA